MKKILTWEVVLVGLLILLALFLRMYKIESPIADWHSWRQADTAAVARNFYQEGFNPFLPRYDDMSRVSEKTSSPNIERLKLVEFPIYNSIVYFSYLLNGGVDERLARLVNIVFSLVSLTFIYLIARQYFCKLNAFISALLFAVLPFSVFYSRVILPEPFLLMSSLGMFYFASKWVSLGQNRYFLPAILFGMAAMLTKPVAIFYLPPIFFLAYEKQQSFFKALERFLLLLGPIITPYILWQVWINQYPAGIPASSWLFNGDGIRFRPAFWRWILAERLGKEMLAVSGFGLFLIGVLIKPLVKEGKALYLLLGMMFLYLIIFATGNVTHDYYQVLILPVLLFFVSRGFVLLITNRQYFLPRIFSIPVAAMLLILTPYLGWLEVRDLYRVNNPVIVEVGKEADKLLPKEAKVVASYNGDTAFSYQVNRPGWAIADIPMDQLRDGYGVSHYLSVNFDDKTNWVMKKYKVVKQTDKYVIVDLRFVNPEFNGNLSKEPF